MLEISGIFRLTALLSKQCHCALSTLLLSSSSSLSSLHYCNFDDHSASRAQCRDFLLRGQILIWAAIQSSSGPIQSFAAPYNHLWPHIIIRHWLALVFCYQLKQNAINIEKITQLFELKHGTTTKDKDKVHICNRGYICSKDQKCV